MGNGFILAETGGVEEVTLTTNQIPSHTHPMVATGNPANAASPTNAILGTSSQVTMYFGDPPSQNMNLQNIGLIGGSQPHTNLQPYLGINFIISLFGIFPNPS